MFAVALRRPACSAAILRHHAPIISSTTRLGLRSVMSRRFAHDNFPKALLYDQSTRPNHSLRNNHIPSPKFADSGPVASWRRVWMSGVVGVGLLLYHSLRFPQQVAPAASIDIPAPPAEFNHPYNDAPWYWKAFLTMKRLCVLTALFVPCAAVGMVVALTDASSLRAYWIEMLQRAFEAAGCGFQKFGQWISMRPDMFPPDVVKAMGHLRMDVPPHSFEHTRAMIKESFGANIDDIFESFDPTPIASGTVAQVHHARLKPEHAISGKIVDVAVKVRHPSVLEETFIDVDFIFRFLNSSDFMTVPFEKANFLTGLQKQINFEWEAYSLAKFANNFKSEMEKGDVSFPTVSFDLLSPSVLIESWANGHTVGHYLQEVGFGFKELKRSADKVIEARRKEIAERVFTVGMKMFLRDNLMHGDLHAGNVMYDDKTHALTVLDAGHTTSLAPENASQFSRFMHGLITGTTSEVVTSLLSFNQQPIAEVNVPVFTADIERTLRRFVAKNGRSHENEAVCIGDVVGELLFKLHRHHVTLRGDVASSIMAIAVTEGLIRSLDPSFDMNMRALPYIAKYGTSSAAAM